MATTARLSSNGQPFISIADVQWVLHNATYGEELSAEVLRGGRKHSVVLPLESGWRRRGDISWRATSWDPRRMMTGGMRLDDLSGEAWRELGLGEDVLGLRVRYLGQNYNFLSIAAARSS